jgi:hypothetical protein
MNDRAEQTEDFTDGRNELKFDQSDASMLHSEPGRKILLAKHNFINDRFMIPIEAELGKAEMNRPLQSTSRELTGSRRLVISNCCDGALNFLLNHLSCKEKDCFCEATMDHNQTTPLSKKDIVLLPHHAS